MAQSKASAISTTQISSIINDVTRQMTGVDELKTLDTNSIVTLGTQVLCTNQATESFLNTLALRISWTIIRYRMYRSHLRELFVSDIEWGGIVQKIRVAMPEAVNDDSYDLAENEGKSIDMYTIKLPKVLQKFFVNRTPYMYYITIQRFQLQRAFTGAGELESFVNAIFGEVRNKIELALEGQGYAAMTNFISNILGTKQEFQTISTYNTIFGTSLSQQTAIYDSKWLRWVVAQMNIYSKRMEGSTGLYNKSNLPASTPIAMQRFVVLNDFNEYMRTVVQWEAFHSEYVEKAASVVVPWWQNPNKPFWINATDSNGTEHTAQVLAFMHDRDALGAYLKEDEVLTTPLNARGRYTNTFWHNEQMWFNDLDENAIVFTYG